MNRLPMCVLIVAGSGVALASDDIPPPRLVNVAALVKQLGSEDYAEREAATRRLSALTLDPPPELLAATQSESPEVRGRAVKVAEAMRGNVAIARIPRGEQFAKQGKVDLFVAATAVWDLKPEVRRLWQPALDLGRRLIAKADMTGNRKPNGCPAAYKDFETFHDQKSPRYTRLDVTYLRPDPQKENPPILFRNEAIQAPGVVGPTGHFGDIIVSRGSVQTETGIQTSVVLANGDISAGTIMHKSVLVCDGDVTITGGPIIGCVIVARGNITAAEGADTSVLMAGGKVTLRKERVTKRQAEGGHYNVVEGEPNTLGLTFFELRDTLGVVVKVTDGNVTVANFKVRGAFAAAGVEIGDVITAVNGKKPDSAESLRRLLRDALAIGDATVTLKRGDRTETVKVSLPE